MNKNYVKVDCKDNHTFRLLKNYLDSKYEIVTSNIQNVIFVFAEDLSKAENIFDDIAYQDDMWNDIKINEMVIK